MSSYWVVGCIGITNGVSTSYVQLTPPSSTRCAIGASLLESFTGMAATAGTETPEVSDRASIEEPGLSDLAS